MKGGTNFANNWETVYKDDSDRSCDRVFYVCPGADSIKVTFQSMMTASKIKVETATEAEAVSYANTVWAEVNKDKVATAVTAYSPDLLIIC